MSSVARGDAFEERVYRALVEELHNERLGASPKASRIFRRKAYHSRDRGASIITDVSIEVFLPGREGPSLVWVFECKDYTGTVGVDNVEEFHAKLQQIGEDNTKGTFVTTGAMQRGALSYARSKGIGIIRLLPDDRVTHIMEMLTASDRTFQVDWSEFESALTDPNHRSRREFFAAEGLHFFSNWHGMLSHTLLPDGSA